MFAAMNPYHIHLLFRNKIPGIKITFQREVSCLSILSLNYVNSVMKAKFGIRNLYRDRPGNREWYSATHKLCVTLYNTRCATVSANS